MERLNLDEAIAFCYEKSENIKMKAEPQIFINIAKQLEELKRYKDAEEQKLLLKLPCPPGTTFWTFDSQYWIDEEKCKGCKFYYDDGAESFCDCYKDYPECAQVIEKYFLNTLEIVSVMKNIGKTIFFSKEEAEEVLKKIKEV